MYEAIDNHIYYIGEDDDPQLFITIHPTRDCTKTPQEQAKILTDMLNKMMEDR
jgi:hypothetical protein